MSFQSEFEESEAEGGMQELFGKSKCQDLDNQGGEEL